MRPVARHPWSFLLALPFFFGAAIAYSQTSNQDLGQFQGQGDFGTILLPGSGHYDASKDSYTVSGSGANLWFGIDDFHYVWRKMSGDVALSADIDFVGEKGNAHRKAVLMIRQSLDPHSIYADVARHGDGLTSLQYRDTIGADTHEIETYGRGPHRVRIEKRGDYVYVSIADANGNVTPSGAAMRVSIQGDFYLGLGVCSHDERVIETAIFSNVKTEPLSPLTTQPVLHSTLETVIVASTDRRVRYTAPIHFEDPNWTPEGKALIFNQEGSLQYFRLDDGIHPIDSTIPRSTSSTLISTAPVWFALGRAGAGKQSDDWRRRSRQLRVVECGRWVRRGSPARAWLGTHRRSAWQCGHGRRHRSHRRPTRKQRAYVRRPQRARFFSSTRLPHPAATAASYGPSWTFITRAVRPCRRATSST